MFGIGIAELAIIAAIPAVMVLTALACLVQIRNAIQRIDRRLSEIIPPAGAKTCPHCGTHNPSHETLCAHCAQRI